MAGYLQWVAAAGIAVVLIIIVLGVYGTSVPIPGLPWRADVTIDVSRGWTGNPTCSIGDVRVYRGFSIKPIEIVIPPLLFGAEYRVVVTSPDGHQAAAKFSVDINSTASVTVTVDMPDPPHGKITAVLYDMGGVVMSTSERTI
jgi:hypothetical protein